MRHPLLLLAALSAAAGWHIARTALHRGPARADTAHALDAARYVMAAGRPRGPVRYTTGPCPDHPDCATVTRADGHTDHFRYTHTGIGDDPAPGPLTHTDPNTGRASTPPVE